MKKIMPFNNIVLGRKIDKEVKSSIVLPNQKEGRFIRVQIIAVGGLVEEMKPGEIVIANNMLEVIDSTNPDVGFINSRDILAKEKEIGPRES